MYMKYSEKGLIAHIRESVLALRKDFGIKISHHEVPKNAGAECENNKTNSIKKNSFYNCFYVLAGSKSLDIRNTIQAFQRRGRIFSSCHNIKSKRREIK